MWSSQSWDYLRRSCFGWNSSGCCKSWCEQWWSTLHAGSTERSQRVRVHTHWQDKHKLEWHVTPPPTCIIYLFKNIPCLEFFKGLIRMKDWFLMSPLTGLLAEHYVEQSLICQPIHKDQFNSSLTSSLSNTIKKKVNTDINKDARLHFFQLCSKSQTSYPR